MAAQILAIDRDGGERAAIVIEADTDDRRSTLNCRRQSALRTKGVSGGALAALPAMPRQLGRIDAQEADTLTAAAEGVSINGDQRAGEWNSKKEHSRILAALDHAGKTAE